MLQIIHPIFQTLFQAFMIMLSVSCPNIFVVKYCDDDSSPNRWYTKGEALCASSCILVHIQILHYFTRTVHAILVKILLGNVEIYQNGDNYIQNVVLASNFFSLSHSTVSCSKQVGTQTFTGFCCDDSTSEIFQYLQLVLLRVFVRACPHEGHIAQLTRRNTRKLLHILGRKPDKLHYFFIKYHNLVFM